MWNIRLLPSFALLAFAIPQTSVSAASSDSSQAAWNLFARINQPGSDGLVSLWETWATPDDLYPLPPKVPAWPTAAPGFKKFETLQQEFTMLTLTLSPNQLENVRSRIDLSMSSEVHLNCATFAFVVKYNFWNSQVQMDRAKAIEQGKATPIRFPDESVAVKAKWRPLDPQKDNPVRFHVATGPDQKPWVLIGLHITSREQPNWLWATWEHMDNPYRPTSGDTFGFPNGSNTPSAGLAQILKQLRPEWGYYRLDGSQTDYLEPKLLGNSTMEGGFLTTSSCITCHARATRSKDDEHLPVFDGSSNGFVGTPPAGWYTSASGSLLMQTDFLWTMANRPYWFANAQMVAPPDCNRFP